MTELRRGRAQGYAIIDQELELGLCSIAVPLMNARGQVVAAIHIGACRPRRGRRIGGARSIVA